MVIWMALHVARELTAHHTCSLAVSMYTRRRPPSPPSPSLPPSRTIFRNVESEGSQLICVAFEFKGAKPAVAAAPQTHFQFDVQDAQLIELMLNVRERNGHATILKSSIPSRQDTQENAQIVTVLTSDTLHPF